jgi:hypothetical protein
VDKPDAPYKVVATIKDSVNTAGINSDELSVNRLPVYDYNKDNFNFNVPIYYKDKPYIEWKRAKLMTDDYWGTVNWIYKITEDKYVELWGKLSTSLTINKATGSMYAGTRSIKISLPEDVEIERRYGPVPCTITASASVINANGEYDTSKLITVASPYVSGDGQYAGLTCLAPVSHGSNSNTVEVCLHISGVKVGAFNPETDFA